MLHILPLFDLRDHWCSADCWCQPELEEGEEGGEDLLVHHALDQRERYESGELRLH